SRKLFESLPSRGKRGQSLDVIRGSVPPLTREFQGCRFADRCDAAWDLCRRVPPPLYDLGGGQVARCHLYAPAGAGAGEARGERREETAGRREAATPPSAAQPP